MKAQQLLVTKSELLVGDYAEILFDAGSTLLGMYSSKPVRSGCHYDRIVDSNGFISRVQIKCVNKINKYGSYYLNLKTTTGYGYPVDSVDVFAIYWVVLDRWFFVRNTGQKGFTVSGNVAKFDNWDIFNEKIQDNIQAIQKGVGLRRPWEYVDRNRRQGSGEEAHGDMPSRNDSPVVA